MSDTSTRWGIAEPSSNRSDPADVPLFIRNVVAALEAMGIQYGQGPAASRPVSTPSTPGKEGRIYVSTDLTPKIVEYDYGTGWLFVNSIPDDTVTTAMLQDLIVTSAKMALGVDPTAYGTAFPTSGLFNGYRYPLLISGVLFDFMYRHDLDATYGWYCLGGPGYEQEGTDITYNVPIAGHWRGHFGGWASVSSLGDATVHNSFAGAAGQGNFGAASAPFVTGALSAGNGIRSWISGTNNLSGHVGHIIWPYKLLG